MTGGEKLVVVVGQWVDREREDVTLVVVVFIMLFFCFVLFALSCDILGWRWWWWWWSVSDRSVSPCVCMCKQSVMATKGDGVLRALLVLLLMLSDFPLSLFAFSPSLSSTLVFFPSPDKVDVRE